MKSAITLILFLLTCLMAPGETAKPLRVFIRAGPKTHGPGQHDHPRFLSEWKDLLNQRGAQTHGALGFPSPEQLAETDVLIISSGDGGDLSTEQRTSLDQFLKRGGGLVVMHDGICGHDPQWWKTIIGGAWEYNRAGFFEGDLSFYYQDHTHPITRGASNFDFNDEMYYDLDLMPEVHVLAATYKPDARNKRDGRIQPSIYDIVPQMWTYEKDNYRAFVCIPGHNYKNFSLPHFRAVVLRGIAWAGKRDADLLVSKEELGVLKYPEGGPTAPEAAAAKIVVPADFTLNLVASEPLIEKPISIDWDPKGRMWIAETPEYPYRQDRSRPPRDRISILEDADGDGRMDRKSVFYEGLDLVTSMLFYRDGVIVSQAPDIYWLRDTKGTGHADKKEVLYTGFGTRDTHAVVSNLRWGHDGWIYATVGYSKGDIYSGDHQKHLGTVSEGVIRFQPDGSAIEQVSSKGGNTWGVDIAPDGEIFFSQANGNHIDHVVMTESALARGRMGRTTSFNIIEDHNRSFPLMSWTKQAYVQIDFVGNFTGASGACIYDGGAWPAVYDYTYYVAEPTINIVHQDVLKPKGATYAASRASEFSDKEFIGSTDLWFRPIHQRVGPDGALYVLDFYNQAIIHNDPRGVKGDPQSNAAIRPDRDHYFGRIWRVQHKDAKKLTLPKLASARTADLLKALEHPNMWVRSTAQRLLVERNRTEAVPKLEALAKSEPAPAWARIHALWTLNGLSGKAGFKEKELPLLVAAMSSTNAAVRKNALAVAEVWTRTIGYPEQSFSRAVLDRVKDEDPRVRLAALLTLPHLDLDSASITEVATQYSKLNDPWLESAAIGVAAEYPVKFMEAAMDDSSQGLTEFVTQVAGQVAEKGNAALAAQTVVMIASKPAAADSLKLATLESLARNLKPNVVPEWSTNLQQAFQNLLGSTNITVASAALPLLARWDQSGLLATETKSYTQKLLARLNDTQADDEDRARLATSLLALRQTSPDVLPAVAKLLGPTSSPALQWRVIESLGNVPDPTVGAILVEAYGKVDLDWRDRVLNQLFKRPDWSMALLDAIQSGKIKLAGLGPVAVNRLRTHSDKAVSEQANRIIDELRGPEVKEKDILIAKFTPLVTQPGDATKGKQLFTQNCAVCHKFNGEGRDLAPDLTGMGAHGPAQLIVDVLDPNRTVEPNFYSYSIETKDGESYDGVIARENQTGVTLRNAAGDTEIKRGDIRSRRNTGLSLMPNGFESLGADALRDILSYLCAGETRYRIIDLGAAFTADGSKGLWHSQENAGEALAFKKYGLNKVDNVPFEVVNPIKSASGKNVIVLQGTQGLAVNYPPRVEIKNIGVKAAQLHFLGGVGGWAYPCCGDNKHEDMPVAKVTVRYEDNESEEIILRNGQEFADYIGLYDVPGSKLAPDLMTRGQMRCFTKPLKHTGVIQTISLESFNNEVAPAFIAITADTESSPVAAGAGAMAAPAKIEWDAGAHVLSIGGGNAHDFNRWFNQADTITLGNSGKYSVRYTDKLEQVLPALKDTRVLYLSLNQPVNDPQLRQALFQFVDAGHGLLLFHAGVWYNWKDWPEYNRVLAGGGASSHDALGEFEVTITDTNHPVVAGVPKTFRITDELYHTEIDPKGTPIQVLAESRNLTNGKTYPALWIVKYPHGRIVCCALGHDGKAHESDAFKAILQNSLRWADGN